MSGLSVHETVPRGALIAIGSILLGTLVAVAAVRWSGAQIRHPDAAPLVSRALAFEDGPEGTVRVIDPRDGSLLHEASGEQGFLRGALRALSRERRIRGIGPGEPLLLVRRADARLTLIDPATDQRIDLESFGPTNAGVFARLLDLPAAADARR